MNTRTLALALVLPLAVLPAASCAKEAPKASDGTQKVEVVASFYPLQYLVEQVGGEHVTVKNLTKPGAEPHDLELSPKDVGDIEKAKLVVFEKGLQPPVDKAVEAEAKDRALDIAPAVDLSLKFDPALNAEAEDEHHDEHEATPTTGATTGAHEDEHDHEHEAEAGSTDPHFWVDPVRYGKAAEAIAARLKEIDPAHAATYDANLAKLTGRTGELDKKFRTELGSCTSKNLVTAHAAFGYLAHRYGFKQVAIAGLSAEAEPTPGQLAKVSQFVKANDVDTIYTETLLDPKHANTIAKETGAQTAVLDPIEGINDKSAAQDWFGVMEANLATLKKGQQCS